MSQVDSPEHSHSSELLSTKLALPPLRSVLVSRRALLARLDAGLEQKVTLLSAPAGFGKTTLISAWLAHLHAPAASPLGISDSGLRSANTREIRSQRPPVGNPKSPAPAGVKIQNPSVAWVALDAGDNDPVRFWRYLITACQNFDPGLGRPALALLRGPQPASLEMMLTLFINELAALSQRGILVLEDYHVITSRQIHETVAFLLEHLPASLHLVLITRSDPPLPLARLRARHELNELRAADLRFSRVEAQAFLEQAIPFSLSAEVVSRLEARTEGWVAGLRLVALALQGRQDPQEVEQFLTTFTGSHRHILEYLAAEVLAAQPPHLQEFLLRTTFLSRLTGSLCDAVTGRNDSQIILEQLEQANLFLTPLDSDRQWYRYHALFAEAMVHTAQRRLGEADLRALANQASRWYEQHRFLAEAVETALTAHDFVRAAGLIERILEPEELNNEVHTLRRWLEQLPEELLRTRPKLCLSYATTILFTEDRRAPGTLLLLQGPLQMAEQAWQAEGNQAKLGQALALRALVAWWQGDTGQAFAAAGHALELLPERETGWRGANLILVGVEQLFAGRFNSARQTLLEGRALCEAAGNIHGALAAILGMGEVCARQGELHQAAQIYRQVLAQAKEMEVDEPIEDRGYALAGLGALLFEWNDLEGAEQAAVEALEVGRQLAAEDILAPGSLVLARVQQARGETESAQALLHALAARLRWPHLLREVKAGQAWLSLAGGDLAAVQRWAATWAEARDKVSLIQQEQEALLVARMLIAQGEAAAALRLLDQWQAGAQAQGRSRSELEMMVLKALAYFSQSNLPKARQTLLPALALAQPEGYQRLFLAEGEPMATLLQAVLPEVKGEALLAYIQALLAAFANFGFRADPPIQNPELKAPYWKSEIQNLIEPLSSQEQRVLRLLAAGLSNSEIAGELIVSINTIKTQVKSIYRKLDVHSREEAVEVAHRLKLI